MDVRLKVVTIIGARPQFVKASVVSKALRNRGHTEIIINTGQHYDANMSKIFFDEMGIPKPDHDLSVGSGTHAEQTAASMVGIETVLLADRPDYLIVYGDTNATLAGALVAAKLHIPVVHIEAGLRSYNREMPEEINRIVTDVISDFLFVPTQVSVDNLAKEGISKGVHVVGDVMVDALMHYTSIAELNPTILSNLNIARNKFYLMTIHRPSNADNDQRLKAIVDEVSRLNHPVIFPVHPRSRAHIGRLLGNKPGSIQIVEPVGYLDMMLLEKHANMILTDSGGVQKEAYLHKTPCLTIRSETEWVETVRDGWNHLVGDDLSLIGVFGEKYPEPLAWDAHYGDGKTSERIVKVLE